MPYTRIIAALMFVTIIAGTLALSQPSDLAVLRRVGQTTVAQVQSGLPSRLNGPLGSFHAGDALPIEERVRLRIRNDKDLAGAEVQAIATEGGQIKLKGIVSNAGHKSRALELAERTDGVVSVIDELAMPDP